MSGNNSVDVFNSKTIRSSQGAIFYVNVSESPDLNVTLKEMTYKGYNVILTTPGADTGLNDYKFESDKKYVIVFGNEANGISDEIVNDKSYDRISIEGYSDCESLNVSLSAGIVMYKAASDMK
ncbi:MAG: RNA methyltransferase [Ignavibacteriae bacterium]|nr:RNA methyltransferase [Ignavibacteriota bacterium]